MTRVVVTGADGLLGRELVVALRRSSDVTALTHADLEVGDPTSVRQISALGADVIINAAAWTDVDGCALHPERANEINGNGAGLVAREAARTGSLMVQISTNEVFEGDASEPYSEDDTANPVTAYGRSKLIGEQAVADATPRHLIIRTAWLFGRGGEGFPARIRAAATQADASGEPIRVVDDEWGNPTPVESVAPVMAAAVGIAYRGALRSILHVAGEPPTTRLAWARAILGPDAEVVPIPSSEYERASKPPLRAVLSMAKAHAIGLATISWRG